METAALCGLLEMQTSDGSRDLNIEPIKDYLRELLATKSYTKAQDNINPLKPEAFDYETVDLIRHKCPKHKQSLKLPCTP